MKKYLVLVVNFIITFLLFQGLSGMISTLSYTPDITNLWNMSIPTASEGMIIANNSSFLLTLLSPVLAATIAYLVLRKVSNNERAA
jgi:hypothetical protein